jgi:hypothetical protein
MNQFLRFSAIGLSVFCSAAASAQMLSGFDLRDKQYVGPSVEAVSADPIWVADYHTLTVDYRATGVVRADYAVLTLRPGSVGPITPHATNPENPLAAGEDVVVMRGRDLILDGRPHKFQTNLTGAVKTPQIDALLFALPAGAKLNVANLEFRADPELLPCAQSTPAEIPADSKPITVHGPLACDGAAATSLREQQSISIAASGKRGATLYLDLLTYLAGFSNFDASKPQRPAETSDTSFAIANIRYADRPAQVVQQFPMLVSEHTHVLLNRKRALYALELDPSRRLLSVELADRSPHVQLVLFRAAISSRREVSADEPEVLRPAQAMSTECTAAATLSNSGWYKIAGDSASAVKADLVKTATANGIDLSLVLTNNADRGTDLVVSFPSLDIRVAADPHDVSYLFPQKVANVSNRDASLTEDYGPNFLLQFTDVFAERAGCGVAVIVKDAGGQSKSFHLAKDKNSVTDSTEYHVHLGPHETYTAPSVKLVLHNGDWRAGFDAYRQWLAGWYRPETPHPDWLDHAFYMRRDYPTGGSGLLYDAAQNKYTFPKLIDEGKAFGGVDFIDISGWALSETHGRVGDYPIELSTPSDLADGIRQTWSKHIPTGLYFEGFLVDKNSDVGRAHGDKWRIIGADGKGLWWPGGNPEMFLCPNVKDWQDYLSNRLATVAKQVGAQAVYLDEYNCAERHCYSPDHGHPVGANVIDGQIQTARKVRQALDKDGLTNTILYVECPPVDIATPFVDGAFTYALPGSKATAYNVKLNLYRFAFPQVRLWDMVSAGVEPHLLSAENFRLAFWNGDGVWLKGRADTWYGQDVLEFLRWAHPLYLAHAKAFSGQADALVDSGDSHILMNRFRGGGETVYTILNNTYETRQFTFHGKQLSLAPRGVQLIAESKE